MRRLAKRGPTDAVVTAPSPTDAVAPTPQPPLRDRSPVAWGYLVSLGIVGGILTGLAFYGLRSIIFSVFLAAFATVGLDPLIRWFQRRGMNRAWAIITVILLIVALLVTILWVVIPLIVEQIKVWVEVIPQEIQRLREEGWFDEVDDGSNGVLGILLVWIAQEVQDPALWTTIGSGLVGFGLDVVAGFASGFFIAILTIYFIATYDSTKQAAYKLVSASNRPTVVSYAERILENFGKYLSGMVVLAFFNSVYSLVLLLLAQVPGAFLISIAVFFITLIPLIGTIITTAFMSLFAFIHSPVSGLVVLLAMLVYMQIEAYVLTPWVMGKAVKVPGSVVLISALAGSTLFGLAGALVAIPISAGIILIIKEVVMPRKERR